ncbi:Tn3 family transposase [Streptomyces sp. MS1.AVA.3]
MGPTDTAQAGQLLVGVGLIHPRRKVTDTASYSDIVFGLLTLAGFAYAPQPADLPDCLTARQELWRIDRTADYGAFQDAARARNNLARIGRAGRASCGSWTVVMDCPSAHSHSCRSCASLQSGAWNPDEAAHLAV